MINLPNRAIKTHLMCLNLPLKKNFLDVIEIDLEPHPNPRAKKDATVP